MIREILSVVLSRKKMVVCYLGVGGLVINTPLPGKKNPGSSTAFCLHFMAYCYCLIESAKIHFFINSSDFSS